MMAKTHLAVGMAVSLALLPYNTPAAIATAVAGGAVGGVLADVDTLKKDYQQDALSGELFAFGLLTCMAVLDYFLNWGFCKQIIEQPAVAVVGAVCFVALWIFGFTREHRTFTHSLLAMFLFSFFSVMIYPQLGIFVFFGYLSHLLLDLLNKKGILLLYPLKKEFCLNLCYAGKVANTIFMILGFVATAALLIYRTLILCNVL